MINLDLFTGKMIDVGKNERRKVKSSYYENVLKVCKELSYVKIYC